MIRLVSYTDSRMTISAQRLAESAIKMGADSVKIYGHSDLDLSFRVHMIETLAAPRGAGWYCWKAWCIAYSMEDMADGDYLFWSDAGTEIIAPLQLLTNAMDEDIMFFSNGWRHIEWCKMDLLKYCFKYYGTADNSSFDQSFIDNAHQVQASHIMFKVSAESRLWAKHFLSISMIAHLVDNSPSESPNVPTFQEHRWDQAIACCLQLMYGYKLHWFPSHTGHHLPRLQPGDNYPVMFVHHRKRNPGAGGGDSEWTAKELGQ